MRKIWQLGATLAILGMIAGCNLTSAPPSSLPRVSSKPGLEKPRQKPAPSAQQPIASATNNPNLLLGNPSNAAANTANIDNYLMVKPQYVLSYNNKTHTANWVSWQLNRSWIGAAAKTISAPTVRSPMPGTKCDRAITQVAATTVDTSHPAPIALAMKRTTAALF